ncbi:hypothetical protein JHK85_023024 [Glycine max]|uniref:Uncharacterized protein n=1 Tax=Glycine soja TaxID=3848 RepID=A0A445JK92_GLYSO|nr:hypothetical protein JHK85_023024 [Glycine max]RZB98902.1 hypothetical protein D0Y65_021678 [Glycine soja]
MRNPLKEEEQEIYVVLVLFGSSDWSFVEARVRLRLCLLHATLVGVEFCCFDEFEVKKDMLWNSGLLWRLSDKKILCFLPPLESGSHLMFLKL